MHQNQVYKVKTVPELTQYCPDSDYTLFAQKLKTTLVTSCSQHSNCSCALSTDHNCLFGNPFFWLLQMEVTKESVYGNGFKFPKITLKREKFKKIRRSYEDGFSKSFHISGIHTVSTWYKDH